MSADQLFSAEQRAAVYRAIFERRDVRSYLPDPVPDAVLTRVLEAAHHAPSVGFMQPWSFLIVRDPATRAAVHAHFLAVNQRAAQVFSDERRSTYQALKLQGILDAPLALVVTCDPTRAGEHVLGRFTMPETDVYSTCLAIQNLWLAARVEGLGVGWMSIMEKGTMRALLGIPEHVEIVAFLTLGYPVEFAREPLLSQVGWRQRLPLQEVVFEERWGQRAAATPSSQAERPCASEPALAGSLEPPEAALERNRELTKPPGSLGRVEELTLKLAGIQQTVYPSCDAACLLLFAGDHGVTAQRVSAYKRETTLKMIYSYLAGGAVINALAREYAVPLEIIDVGVDHDFGDAAGLIQRKIARGTHDFTRQPALTADQCTRACAVGSERVARLRERAPLLLGEMGIGNSTSASALAAALLGLSPEASVGPGTGVGAAGRARKIEAVQRALALHGYARGETGEARARDATEVLTALGGYEIAALVGAIEQAAARRMLVLLDGFITGVAALVAARRTPAVLPFLVASHQSAEPAHAAVLDALSLEPLLALRMRLGEGSGAMLAFGLLRAGCRVMREVRTFAEANIDHPDAGEG
ncbi:MAG TPA: nicotinate-nucleotide--dimethylbenzimidazole phosphoribosyltransferase [Polyangiales bacterium]